MGIRYYAYAVDADRMAEALANPRAFISSDPLADAWGMGPHASYSIATFQQRTPRRDLLYLDKAWRDLQAITGPMRPAYRLFEGDVAMSSDGYSWTPWVRALSPDEIATIAADLMRITPALVRKQCSLRGASAEDTDYVVHFLERARTFVRGLVRDGRGLAYLIG